ncbi:MAG: hypothetical protein U1G07_21850 [Verrucomicrobiota bacterium]
MREAKQVADGTFDAGMLLTVPPRRITQARCTSGSRSVVIHKCRIVPGPLISHSSTVSPGLISRAGAPLRPGPSLLAALPPAPGSPEGFSNEIDREISPVSKR